MTTIAYKDGVIAYDSRKTAGDLIVDDDYDKHAESNGVHFFTSGTVGDVQKFIDAWNGVAVEGDIEISALVWDGENIWASSWNENGLWKTPVDREKPYSLGSGSHHAWTAMDMGASSAEAIQMAIKRDAGTGGRVREFSINGIQFEFLETE